MMILRTDFGGTKLRKLNAATTEHAGFVRFGQTNCAPRELLAEYFLYRLDGGLPAFVQISAMKTDSVSFRVNDLGHKSFIEGVIP